MLKAIAIAMFAITAAPLAAPAQTIAEVGDPAELPDAGFRGQQYVDSRGCVYLRAGFGGKTVWVPRVNRDHKAMCGQAPTAGARPSIAVATDAPKVEAAPAVPPAAAKPVALRVRVAPVVGAPAATGQIATVGTAANRAIATSPAGYKPAWTDGRLNPNRGLGTAQGWTDQDQVWTREVPAELVADQTGTKNGYGVVRIPAPARHQVSVSTKSAADAPPVAAPAAAYVQIGTFAVASNARGASARLAAMGLPVSVARIGRAGTAMQVIYAGPFASAAAARQALVAARNAGFSEAFIR